MSGPCPAARQLYWIGTATSGHHNVAPGSAQERSARGGAAAAVLGRYGGGCVAMACGSVGSGGRRCGPKGAEGGVRKVASARGRRQRSDFSAFIVRGDVACIFFGGETQFENFRKFHGFGSFQSGVHSVPVAGDTTRKVEAGRCWDR